MRRKIILLALAFAACVLLLSCAKDKTEELLLDNSDPLALAPDIRWALVDDPYAAFREKTSWDSEAVGYCKQGDYFAILASASVSGQNGVETWYMFDDGWLPASAVSVYPNKLRAAKAAAKLGAKK